MIPGVNIIDRKASEASNMQALQASTELGDLWRAINPQRKKSKEVALPKFSGSKEHLDWLRINLNKARIINVQNYKRTKI